MRKPLAIATGLTALFLAGPAVAFQQSPEAPPATASEAAAAAKVPAELGSPGAGAEQNSEKKGMTVFGVGILPKLDFGLELLYGQQQMQLQQQGGPTSEETEGVTVLGKVNRRF